MAEKNLKQQAAMAACELLEPDMVLGVGTGSTTDAFIELIASKKHWFQAVVSSSESTTTKLKDCGISVVNPNTVMIDLYVDGADEIDAYLQLIKGGGSRSYARENFGCFCKRVCGYCRWFKKSRSIGRFPPLACRGPSFG